MDFASLLGGIASFASNLYGTMYGADRADEDRALTLDLFNKSREFQLQDQGWTEDVSKRLMNYQYSKYSSPSAQMQAYRDAGLNPWLMSQGGSVGSGQGVSVPGVSNPQRSGTPDVFRPQIQKDLFGDAGALITQASAIANQRLEAKAKVASAIPDLVKGVGEDAAKRFLSSLFGNDVGLASISRMVNNEVSQSNYRTAVAQVESQIAQEYGLQEAGNKVALQQAEFQNYSAKWNLMQKEIEHKDADIKKLASEYVRNVADAWHLRKSGEYYEASANTINALRALTKESLQLKVNSMRRADVTEQAFFEGMRGLREHVSAEGDKLINDRFIENWDIETDPFYNEVNKILSSFSVRTNLGIAFGNLSKDVNHNYNFVNP